MKIKLSEIFLPPSGKSSVSAHELYNLELQPHFIKRLSELFKLPFVQSSSLTSDLCFANNRDVRAEYRHSFCKEDILEIILPQFPDLVNLEKDKVHFPQNAQELFSEAFRQSVSIKTEKQRLRDAMLKQRNKLPRKERKAYSENICQRLWDLIEQKSIRSIHSYLPMGSEVDTLPLLQKALDSGLTVVVPKTLRKRQMQNLVLTDLKNMELGIFNTYHPKDATEYSGQYDLIIVAGLLFDSKGFRIGYGGGYYDTFLADQKNALKVGVCFPFQATETVPIESHDVPLDLLFS